MTAPMVNCCKPILRYAPSGLAWYHAVDCVRDPNEKIYRPPKRETEHLRIVQHGEDSRAAVATLAHPAGKGSFGDAVSTWLSHEDDCTCQSCGYVESHLDDEVAR